MAKVKKRKLSCRAIAKEFKIGKTQPINVVKNETKFRVEFENFQGKGFKHNFYQKWESPKIQAYKWHSFSWFK